MLTYCNYHRHSHYTNVRISDSAVTNEAYAKRAVELGHGLLSSCEHGWQGNYNEVIKLAKANGLKALVSAEAYWVVDRNEKDRSNYHIFIGAMNERGRRALNDVLSEANLTGFYGQPRIDIPLILSLPKDDVIVTTACVAYWGNENIEEITKKFAEHFGDHFYLEVQYHNTPSQIELNKRILQLRKEIGCKIIMGCDSHYIYENQGQNRTDFINSKGIEYPEEEGWFLDYPDGDTAYQRFANQCVLSHEEIIEAMENTKVFLNVEEYDCPIFNDELKLPSLYPEWTQEQKDAEYQRLVWQGWNAYKNGVPEERWPEYEEEIKKEIQTVLDTRMSDYFIIDYEVMKKGKENGGWLTKSGRGSGASFFTNTLLGFSDIDRISAAVHMYPERFMSTTRILQSKGIPDIDMNEAPTAPFVQAQAEILGQEHSYPMLAYGTMKKSAAWKLYAKSQGVPFDIANAVSEQIARYEMAVKHADEDDKDSIDIDHFISKDYRDIYAKSADYLGLITSWSIAPCSSLIYDGDIRTEIGLVKIKDNICCLMDGRWAEDGHFLKNDHLKVSVVDLIYRAYHRIGMEPPAVKDLLAMCPPDDPAWSVYERGCTLGINQCEKDGTRNRVMKYKPHNISELSAFVAAIRPGGASFYKQFESREPFSYGVKAFDELIQTKEFPYSFLLYQEQVMRALNYAGIDMADCYTAIKNIAKKRAEKVLAYKERFIDGFAAAIIRDENKSKEEADALANTLWKVIEDASGYSFNCIAGDTKLMCLGLKKDDYQPTVEEMYRIKHDKEYAEETGHLALRKKYRCSGIGYGKTISLFADNRLHPNRIVDIRPAGIKQVYLVSTVHGRQIECTAEHKFLTPRGQVETNNLGVGDEIYVCGQYEKNRTKYPFTDGNYDSNVPKPGEKGFQTRPDGATVVFNSVKTKHELQKDVCEQCGAKYAPDKHFELHHINFDRTNNCKDNLAWLCPSCHKKIHYQHGRVKWGEKGFPVEIDTIISITPTRETMTYDIEMDDLAHNFAVSGGIIVANCSHAYCVAIDSLYGAWLKAHHPLEFYETYINLMEDKGDKDKINAAREEASEYFGIVFEPLRFGQDNRSIHASKEGTMINTLGSIKGYGVTIGRTLFDCSKHNFDNFIDVLSYLDEHGIKEAKFRPLILIDYFCQFGNQSELIRISKMWEFFKQGTAKSIKRDSVNDDNLRTIIEKYTTWKTKAGKDAASYTFASPEDTILCLKDCEKFIKQLNLEEIGMRVRMQNCIDILGYCDIKTGKPEDRRRLVITDVTPVKSQNSGDVWAYRVSTKSLGSGKSARLTVRVNDYNAKPINKGDIVYATDVFLNPKGYWYLSEYRIEA